MIQRFDSNSEKNESKMVAVTVTVTMPIYVMQTPEVRLSKDIKISIFSEFFLSFNLCFCYGIMKIVRKR